MPLENHRILSDKEFEVLFNQCSFNPKDFTHEAHLRLAWIQIKKYGVLEAITNIQHQLKAFVAHVGAKDKYNTTLTIASVKIVNHFMLKEQAATFNTFIETFPQIKHKFKTLVEQHYGFDIFNSEEARQKYLEPDLLPFD